MARKQADTFPCPNCGAEVRTGARSCPECGADDETGWSDETLYDGLDLPDRGEESEAPPRAANRSRIWTITAALILAAIAVMFLMRAFG